MQRALSGAVPLQQVWGPAYRSMYCCTSRPVGYLQNRRAGQGGAWEAEGERADTRRGGRAAPALGRAISGRARRCHWHRRMRSGADAPGARASENMAAPPRSRGVRLGVGPGVARDHKVPLADLRRRERGNAGGKVRCRRVDGSRREPAGLAPMAAWMAAWKAPWPSERLPGLTCSA